MAMMGGKLFNMFNQYSDEQLIAVLNSRNYNQEAKYIANDILQHRHPEGMPAPAAPGAPGYGAPMNAPQAYVPSPPQFDPRTSKFYNMFCRYPDMQLQQILSARNYSPEAKAVANAILYERSMANQYPQPAPADFPPAGDVQAYPADNGMAPAPAEYYGDPAANAYDAQPGSFDAQPQAAEYDAQPAADPAQGFKRGVLIQAFDIPAEVMKQFAKYTRIEVYSDKVVGKGSKMGDVTYFYKNYMDVRWTPASVATQYAQVVFITPQNAGNYVVANNLQALNDVNKIPFCSGMFSYAAANDYAKTVFMTIKEAMTAYHNAAPDEQGTTVIQQQASAADEIKKFKDLLDAGVISQEEFDAKKKQLLGL